MAKVVDYDAYFEQKKGFFGLSNIQKHIVTLGMFAYATNKYCSCEITRLSSPWNTLLLQFVFAFMMSTCKGQLHNWHCKKNEDQWR